MNVELFEGNVDQLQNRWAVLLAGPATTIEEVVVTHQKAKYIIIWS